MAVVLIITMEGEEMEIVLLGHTGLSYDQNATVSLDAQWFIEATGRFHY